MSPKVAAGLLWSALALAVATLVLMTWHPWVIGSTAGCPPATARAWDGNCYAGKIR